MDDQRGRQGVATRLQGRHDAHAVRAAGVLQVVVLRDPEDIAATSTAAIDISDKDSYQQIHSSWIYEFAELENVVTGRNESRIKAWLTSSHDTFRAPYARTVSRRPRSCVIGGTTNRTQILTDDTGSRRFMIVPVTEPVPREPLAAARDQLWAEAVVAYETGEPWWLDRDADAEREESSRDYEDEDPWQDAIADYSASPAINLDHDPWADLRRHRHGYRAPTRRRAQASKKNSQSSRVDETASQRKRSAEMALREERDQVMIIKTIGRPALGFANSSTITQGRPYRPLRPLLYKGNSNNNNSSRYSIEDRFLCWTSGLTARHGVRS